MTYSSTFERSTGTDQPLRVWFMVTSMPVGGAETLLVNLVERLDRARITPELCCLKQPGPLAEKLDGDVPVHSGFLAHKYDFRVLHRLARQMRRRRVDAVVTVGAGDKMFWGRLAARWAGVPVVLSALHSTGWPDGVGRLNRLLTPWTDGFIAVAERHGSYLVEHERFPADKVYVIPNGVDVDRFRPRPDQRTVVRGEWAIPDDAFVVGVVAALRPEKDLPLFLRVARSVADRLDNAHFMIVGDGCERARLEELARSLTMHDRAHFLGTRHDIPNILAALDVFSLTSRNEANPVSILEAMACELPVVATDVGSVAEVVVSGEVGFLAAPGDEKRLADHWVALGRDAELRRRFGRAGRRLVAERASLEAMVRGYEQLIVGLYQRKRFGRAVDSAAPLPLLQVTR